MGNCFLGLDKYPADETKVSTVLNDFQNKDEELVERLNKVVNDSDINIQVVHCIFITLFSASPSSRTQDLQNVYIELRGVRINTVLQGTHKAIVGKLDSSKGLKQVTGKIIDEIKEKSSQKNDIKISEYADIIDSLSYWGLYDKAGVAKRKDKFFKTLYYDANAGITITTEEATDQFEDSYNDYFESLMDEIKDWRARQIIYTGAPGTGKTYSVRKVVEELAKESNRMEFVQFHSSYDYTDFVEGLRPVTIENKATFVRVDGVFKTFCRKAVRCILDKLDMSIEELFARLKSKEKDDWKEKYESIIQEDENQFYFIIDEINRADIGKVFGELMFGLEQSYRGVIHRFPTQYANLDTYYRENDGEFKKYGETEEEDVFKDGFFIPENLHIIGTMNDIDRSVETFDFALRRRFKWKEIKANNMMAPTLYKILSKKAKNPDKEKLRSLVKDLNERAILLNKCISKKGGVFGLTDAFHLGVSYFSEIHIDDDKSEMVDESNVEYDTLWEESLKPIIAEYIRGRDPQKAEEFLGNCRDSFVNKREIE